MSRKYAHRPASHHKFSIRIGNQWLWTNLWFCSTSGLPVCPPAYHSKFTFIHYAWPCGQKIGGQPNFWYFINRSAKLSDSWRDLGTVRAYRICHNKRNWHNWCQYVSGSVSGDPILGSNFYCSLRVHFGRPADLFWSNSFSAVDLHLSRNVHSWKYKFDLYNPFNKPSRFGHRHSKFERWKSYWWISEYSHKGDHIGANYFWKDNFQWSNRRNFVQFQSLAVSG